MTKKSTKKHQMSCSMSDYLSSEESDTLQDIPEPDHYLYMFNACDRVKIRLKELELLETQMYYQNFVNLIKMKELEKEIVEIKQNRECRSNKDFFSKIMRAFEGERYARNKTFGKYEVDLYFPEYKLALIHLDDVVTKTLRKELYLRKKYISIIYFTNKTNVFDIISAIYQRIRELTQ